MIKVGRQSMKKSVRLVAVTFAAAAAGYAGISSAGPHGGALGMRAMSPVSSGLRTVGGTTVSRFGGTTSKSGISGGGTGQNGISGGGTSKSGISGGGTGQNGISGGG